MIPKGYFKKTRVRKAPNMMCKCGRVRAASSRWCLSCKAEYMREWRKTHPLNEAQKVKANARTYTKNYIKRGLLKRQPCEVCGNPKTEAHHPDYTKPKEVRWLCFKDHRRYHQWFIVLDKLMNEIDT